MIPMLDLLIKHNIDQYISYLSKNPNMLDEKFIYASDRTIETMKHLIRDYEIKVRSGYPREQAHLPAIIVLIDSENETNHGLGDGIDTGYYDKDENYLNWDSEENNSILGHAQMNINIRCEVWSDNAVVTSFLYSIVKFALLSTRFQLEKKGVMLQNLSGGDLEPATEYITDVFIYRRAVILTCEYELTYDIQEFIAGNHDSQFNLGTTIDDIQIDRKGDYGREEKENSD